VDIATLTPTLHVRLTKGRSVRIFGLRPTDRGDVWEAWRVGRAGRRHARILCGAAAVLAHRLAVERRVRCLVARGWRLTTPAPETAPLPPTADAVVALESLVEALGDLRWQLDALDPTGRLRGAADEVRRRLEQAGLRVSVRGRRARAVAARRLGELAEARGDRGAAAVHYRSAMAAWAGVGVRRRLHALEQPVPVRRTVCPPSGARGPSS
jgi:hypothetical protein